MSFQVFRVNALPAVNDRVAGAFYLTRDLFTGDLVCSAVGTDGEEVFSTINRTQIQAMIEATVPDTADKLTTARDITATGDASWTVSFDGSQNVSAALTLAASGVTAGEYSNITVDAKGRVTAARAINGTDIGRGAANGVASLDADGLVPASQLPSYVDDVIEVDDFDKLPGNVDDPGTNGAPSQGKIYVVASGGTSTIYRWSGSTYITIPSGVGTADQAIKLVTPRDIIATGDASWTVNFDGSQNVSAALTLAASGVTAGEYSNITVDAKGRVTAARAINGADIGRGEANGVAPLDANSLVPLANLPASVVNAEVVYVDTFEDLPGEDNDPTGTPSADVLYLVGTSFVVPHRWIGATWSTDFRVQRAQEAVALTAARSITISGDASWTVNFLGNDNVSAALTLAASGVTAGTYANLTIDAKGRVTAARALEATDIPELSYLQVASARALHVDVAEW